jgi:hypothetical protein
MHIPIGIALAIYVACVTPSLYRKWKGERDARRSFAVGSGLARTKR